MSYQNPQILNKTALDVVIYLSSSLIKQPIPLHQGTGEDTIIEVTVPDNLTIGLTATGDVSLANMPVLVEGKITQHANSSGIWLLQQLNASYLSNQPLPASISVQSPSGGENLLYQNVFITNPFGGFSYRKEKDPYVFNFKATIPNINNYSNAVNGVGNLIQTVAGL
jgi:hypothetical protein